MSPESAVMDPSNGHRREIGLLNLNAIDVLAPARGVAVKRLDGDLVSVSRGLMIMRHSRVTARDIHWALLVSLAATPDFGRRRQIVGFVGAALRWARVSGSR